MPVSVNVSEVKIVCILNVQNELFRVFEAKVDNTYATAFDRFIEEHLYGYVNGEIEDRLRAKEVLKLSSLGVLEPSTTEWKLALISDAYTAEEAITIMENNGLLTPYTLVLSHRRPEGLLAVLAEKDNCFAIAQGQHELYRGAIYPRIIPVLEAVLISDKDAFGKSFADLAREILMKDKNFHRLYAAFCQEEIEGVNSWRTEIFQEIIDTDNEKEYRQHKA